MHSLQPSPLLLSLSLLLLIAFLTCHQQSAEAIPNILKVEDNTFAMLNNQSIRRKESRNKEYRFYIPISKGLIGIRKSKGRCPGRITPAQCARYVNANFIDKLGRGIGNEVRKSREGRLGVHKSRRRKRSVVNRSQRCSMLNRKMTRQLISVYAGGILSYITFNLIGKAKEEKKGTMMKTLGEVHGARCTQKLRMTEGSNGNKKRRRKRAITALEEQTYDQDIYRWDGFDEMARRHVRDISQDQEQFRSASVQFRDGGDIEVENESNFVHKHINNVNADGTRQMERHITAVTKQKFSGDVMPRGIGFPDVSFSGAESMRVDTRRGGRGGMGRTRTKGQMARPQIYIGYQVSTPPFISRRVRFTGPNVDYSMNHKFNTGGMPRSILKKTVQRQQPMRQRQRRIYVKKRTSNRGRGYHGGYQGSYYKGNGFRGHSHMDYHHDYDVDNEDSDESDDDDDDDESDEDRNYNHSRSRMSQRRGYQRRGRDHIIVVPTHRRRSSERKKSNFSRIVAAVVVVLFFLIILL